MRSSAGVNRWLPRCRPMGLLAWLVLASLTDGTTAHAQARSNYEELQTFSDVLNLIRINYVDSVSYAAMVRAAVDGVLRTLDPHSRLVPREAVR